MKKILISSLLLLSSVLAKEDYTIEELAKAQNGTFFDLGKEYYKQRNYTKAYEYFEKSSQMGNIKATYNLAILYSKKNFYKRDQKKALSIFQELANKGHAASQNRLGMYYAIGHLVPKDYEKALMWYEKASKQGYVSAHCNLAYMYASGKGVFTNFGRANVFAQQGMKAKNPICLRVWEDYNLENYPEDKGFKFNFYVKP